VSGDMYRVAPYYYLIEVVAIGIGAAVGGLLAPAEYQRLGLAGGTIIGGLLGCTWTWWQLKLHRSAETAPNLLWGRHLFVLIVIGLCLYVLWLACNAWLLSPETWFAAITGLLFFGTGIVVIYLLWWGDPKKSSSQLSHAKRNTVLGICSFVLALTSVFTIFLGNIVFGLLGAGLLSWIGVVALRKAHNKGSNLL